MGRKPNPRPQMALDSVPADTTRSILRQLADLRDLPPVKTDEDVKDRIMYYFRHCDDVGMRPGVEGLCLALGVHRVTVFRWANGEQCSKTRQMLIVAAKNTIAAYLEQLSLTGKINPVTTIFLFKNWLGYRDTVSYESVQIEQKEVLPAADLPKLSDKFVENTIVGEAKNE